MKPMKFPAGAFLEVDDFQGGRKVVLVGKDGVTCWDALDVNLVTPLAIHPVMAPVELGTMISFVQENDLAQAAVKVRDMLRAQMDPRADDSLFMMRALWELKKAADSGAQVGAADFSITEAIKKAEQQEVIAVRIHYAAERFVEMATA